MAFAVARFVAGALLLWLCFLWIFRAFPYLSSGGDVVYRAKLEREIRGRIFPQSHDSLRVLVFGSSRALAGFIPDYFDGLAQADGLRVSSFNSGYPGRTDFVPQLDQMIQHGNIPDAVILTELWQPSPDRKTIFRFINSDFDLAEEIFPFRYLPRDTLNFLLTSRRHGGPGRFYAEARETKEKMLADRGYFFIAEQSHFAGNRLPADFHLPTDRPSQVELRSADPASPELTRLNALLRQHQIACYYAPFYIREGERAPAAAFDSAFAALLKDSGSPCKVVGPDYVRYPPSLFSDQMHLNPDGAKVYTRALYSQLAADLKVEQKIALQ